MSVRDVNVLPPDLPPPVDDGGTRHLAGMSLPDVPLAATDGTTVSLARLPDRSVVYAYPRTGEPGRVAVVDDWDQIPGARGCTPQSCAFRDHHADLKSAGADHVFGLSTQSSASVSANPASLRTSKGRCSRSAISRW